MDIKVSFDLNDFVERWTEDDTLQDEIDAAVKDEIVRAIKSSPEYLQLYNLTVDNFRESMRDKVDGLING